MWTTQHVPATHSIHPQSYYYFACTDVAETLPSPYKALSISAQVNSQLKYIFNSKYKNRKDRQKAQTFFSCTCVGKNHMESYPKPHSNTSLD